ncbi:seryl-tRNA synthetase, partial [Chlamydia psittaci 02DC14]
RSA